MSKTPPSQRGANELPYRQASKNTLEGSFKRKGVADFGTLKRLWSKSPAVRSRLVTGHDPQDAWIDIRGKVGVDVSSKGPKPSFLEREREM